MAPHGCCTPSHECDGTQHRGHLRAAVAGRISGTADDIGSLRAAFAAVFDEVRLRDRSYVADEIRQTVDAMERGEILEAPGALFGRAGGYMLDFYGSWERVAVGFDVAAVNGSGSGVPL
ncbi:MAG: hypothetical protein QOG35_3176 [Solirubrobacteraceae bacterium]|jgi:hypothetical protein|nr:hypothetical protein [Solirubrobacteraceae bacterium]